MRDGLLESDTGRRESPMKVGEAFRVALDALRANGLRSVLTMLGVIIGVAAVVILVAIGSGAKQEVEQQVEGLGSNIIIVVPGKFEFGSAPSVSRLTLDDVDLLGRVVGDRDRVAVTHRVGRDRPGRVARGVRHRQRGQRERAQRLQPAARAR